MLHTLLILLAILLILLNGFFVAAEFAMVKVRRTRVHTLEKIAGMRGKILAKVHAHLDAYLSACQLGITLTSLGLGWIGEPAVATLLEPLLSLVGVQDPETIKVIAFIVAFAIISFLHIVVGELMPKTMAIRQSETISLWTAIPLYSFYWLMYPFIFGLNASANILLKLFRLDATHHGEHSYSSEELKLILKTSHQHGEFTKTEADMMEQTLEFAELQVSDVMRPVKELVALDITKPLADNLQTMIQHRYTRYPVYEGNIGHMLGIAHTKHVFAALHTEANFSDLKTILRPILSVSPQTTAVDLLEKFRGGAVHLALVYDKERLVGFVTLDNLLQVIVGRIKDEFHPTQQDWTALEDGGFEIKGHASIYVLEQLLDIDLSQYPVTMVSGLILHKLERFPILGEIIPLEKFTLTVVDVSNTQVNLVHVYPRT